MAKRILSHRVRLCKIKNPVTSNTPIRSTNLFDAPSVKMPISSEFCQPKVSSKVPSYRQITLRRVRLTPPNRLPNCPHPSQGGVDHFHHHVINQPYLTSIRNRSAASLTASLPALFTSYAQQSSQGCNA